MKEKFLRVLLLLSLFSSLGFTAPLYVGCEDVFPDEWLDLLGLIQSPTALKVILTSQPPAFLDLILYARTFSHHPSGIFFLQPFASQPVLSVILRC